MAPLPNAKHERFAQGLAKGKSQTQSYIDAGYSENGADVSASRLLGNASISARVAELQERAAEKTVLTIAKATEDLLRIAKTAEALCEAPGLSVARASIMDACKLNGLVVDVNDHRSSDGSMATKPTVIEFVSPKSEGDD